MYFVHPQIKLNKAAKAKLSLIKRVNLDKLAKKLSFYFPEKQFVFTDMGRSAFKVIIEKMNLQNSEMLLPAYICDIFYPILRDHNIKPIFLDVDLRTFHIKPEEISNKITSNTKAVLVCHTYGLPIDMEAIRNAVNNRAVIIEDCANSFLAKKGNVYTGNMGDISFFSLYKQFPTLRGGIEVWVKDSPQNAEKGKVFKTSRY
ncbi:UDP-4-amino-4-deoxy-L-arabinose--oxoglutarate aminotransferase [subsurface metagenome]